MDAQPFWKLSPKSPQAVLHVRKTFQDESSLAAQRGPLQTESRVAIQEVLSLGLAIPNICWS